MSKRAERRLDSQRMKAKARRVYRLNNSWRLGEPRNQEFEDAAAKRADHLKSCSCYMCGNPRRCWKDQTRQEDLADLNWKEQYGNSSDSGSAA